MWVKLCGIRDVATARAAVAAGADAIGLNFHEPSVRSVPVDVAREIVEVVRDEVECVGLFVNRPLPDLLAVVDRCGLGTIQLHGDETAEDVAAIARERPELRIVVARRFDGDSEPIDRDLDALSTRGVESYAVLIDAKVDGAYGGTGHRVPWDRLAAVWEHDTRPPLVLAGGLTPENVAEAIRVVRPWGVDTASGVESSRGVKDVAMMQSFVASARG